MVIVDSFKTVRDGLITFNVADYEEQALYGGLRIIGGKLYPPAIKFGSRYFTILYLSEYKATEVYEAVMEKNYTLLTVEEAIKNLIWSDEIVQRFLPNSHREFLAAGEIMDFSDEVV